MSYYGNLIMNNSSNNQANKTHNQCDKKLEAIVSASPDGIGIISPDKKLLFVSDKFAEMFGYSYLDKDNLINKPLEDFIDSSNHKSFNNNFSKLLENTDDGDYRIKEYLAVKKDNSRFYIEINYSILLDTNCNPESIIFVVRDSTERKEMEEELQDSNLKLEALIYATPDGIGMMSLDGKLELVSDKLLEMFGYPIEHKFYLTGMDVFEFIDSTYHDFLRENMNELISGKKESRFTEYMAIRKDSSRFFIEVSSTLLRDSYGNPTGILFVERDITKRKESEEEIKFKNEQLEIANAEKNKFFSIIAHDLRSPFQGLLGMTDILATQYNEFSQDEIKELSTSLHHSVVNLYKLLENLLEWARLQRGSMEYNPEELFLSDIYTTSLDSIKQRALQKEIRIVKDIDVDIKVFADEKMINSVFRNLLSNAIKFTNRGGVIIVNAIEKDEMMIEISVADTGVGISSEVLSKLFKLDEKVGTKGTENEPSTGLGLLLCKEFVERHGGTIRVGSEEGQGSTFSFTLPKTRN